MISFLCCAIDGLKRPRVYAIVNTANSKVYVGSSSRVWNRWNNHKIYLRAQKHNRPNLQNDWDLFGEAAFEFVLLETVENNALLYAVEQVWLDQLQPFNPSFGYNISPTAGSCLGIKSSWLTERNKNNHPWRGKKHPLKSAMNKVDNPMWRPEVVAKFKGDDNCMRNPKIAAKLAGVGNGMYGKTHTPEAREKIRNSKLKLIYQITSPIGETFVINNMKLFCKSHGLTNTKMCNVARGLQAAHKGWTATILQDNRQKAEPESNQF